MTGYFSIKKRLEYVQKNGADAKDTNSPAGSQTFMP
jgi:hypothetical protein